MRKNISLILVVIMFVSLLCSCGAEKTEAPIAESIAESKKETVTTPAETAPDTNESTPNEIDASPAMGGTNVCPVHDYNYHSTPFALIEYIGQDRFMEWANNNDTPNHEGDCLYPDCTIYKCIREFEIPREKLEEIYFKTSDYYSYIWDLDLLYSNDEEAVDQFYRNTEELKAVEEKRHCLWIMKVTVKKDYYDEWMETFGSEAVSPDVSIHDIVDTFDITREDLENRLQNSVPEEYASYDYNFDAIYAKDGGEEVPAYVEDMDFCGIDNIYIE